MRIVSNFGLGILIVSVLLACGKSGLQSLSTQELVAKNDECIDDVPSAPGKVTSCENIRKECARRRREESDFSC